MKTLTKQSKHFYRESSLRWPSSILTAFIAILSVFQVLSACGKVATVSDLTIAKQTLVIQTKELPTMQVGAVSFGIVTTGGTAPLKFTVTGGTLPTGLTMEPLTGVISGTLLTAAGGTSFAFSVNVADSTDLTASQTYTGSISAGSSTLKLHTTALSEITAGVNYSYTLAATGGVLPYSFTVSSGSLPSGMILSQSTGAITGVPLAATSNQPYAFELTVTDAGGIKASKTFLGTVAGSSTSSLSIVTTTIPAPQAGASYLASIGVTGGTAPYAFSITSGTVPAGLSLNASSGLISGTSTFASQGAAFLFTVTVTDIAGLTANRSYSGFVTSYTTSLVPTTLTAASPGSSYSATISTVNGQSPYTYALASGTLPSGLTLNTSTGVISGIVAQAEAGLTKNFTITSTDANGIIASTAFALSTNSFTVTLTTASLSNAVEGTAYSNSSTSLAATGGTAPYTFEYTGTLPSGVGLTSAGVFFGTPATGSGALAAGTTYNISVRARDATSQISAMVALSITVTISTPSVSAGSPTNATLGSAYSYTFSASGGRGPYTYTLTGSLPTGLSMSTAGVVTGTATATTACPAAAFTVQATDALLQTSLASSKCITTVNGVIITNNTFSTVVVGANYSGSVTVTGGTTPYTYSASGLPTGLSINSTTGALSGFTNAATGTYTVYLSVVDSSTPSLSNTRSFTFAVRDPLTVATTSLPRAGTGISYNGGTGFSLTSSGGASPYTYSIVSGSLPSGLSMSAAGLISGTPTSSTAANGGTYTIGVRSADSGGQTSATSNLTLYVTVAPKIRTSKIPVAVLNTPYAVDIQRIGGVNQFNGSAIASRLTWSISGLPAGLSYSATSGRIYGTPTANAGSPYTIAVSVTDQHGFAGTKNLSLKVNAAGKNLDLKSARYSNPCIVTTYGCDPRAFAISFLTGNAQQFAVYSINNTVPRSIQIAKIDSNGRIPAQSQNVTSLNVPLAINTGTVTDIKIADLDQDGYKDIVFVDATIKQVCALWGSSTVNTYGMPSGYSQSSMNCWIIPPGSNGGNGAYFFEIYSNLRPDATNAGKLDIVVSSTSTGDAMINVLLNTCALNAACTSAGQRATLFTGYVSPSGNLTSASTTISGVASTAGVQAGMPIAGLGIPAGAVVSSFVANTSITMNVAATATNSGVVLTTPAAYAVTGTLTNASNVITAVPSTANVYVGQSITHANLPAGTTVRSFVANTSITLSANATATVAGTTVIAFGSTAYRPLIINNTATMRDVYGLGMGFFNSAAVNPPSTFSTSAANCPSIVVGGFQQSNTANGYLHVMRQSWTGSQCQGDFSLHTSATDEVIASTVSPWISDVLATDLNNDGITDIVTTVGSAATANSASVRVYLMPGGGTFSGATNINPQLQMSGANIVGANKVIPYCTNGAKSCSYPSLMVTCNREYQVGASTNFGCLSIIPSQCSTPGCTGLYETSTPTTRIDYALPPGQAMEPIVAPLVSTSTLTPTGTATSGNPTITGMSSMTGLVVGQPVSGTGIPSYSYIVSVGASSITLNQNLNISGSVTVTAPSMPVFTPSGTAVSGNATISSLSSTSGLVVGQSVHGVGVPENTTISSISAPNITLSRAVGLTGTIQLVIVDHNVRQDVFVMGTENTNSAPYALTYARNGSLTDDPLKSDLMLNTFPASYIQPAEVGTMKMTDFNSDTIGDLSAYIVNQGFIANYMSTTSGSPTYSLGTTLKPNYLSNSTFYGCPSSATSCLPDPVFNTMGVNHGFPHTYHHQNSMDLMDLNNDGIEDMAVTGYYSRGVSVALGTSTGVVGSSSLYDVGEGADLRPVAVALGDLDQDGIVDMAVAGWNTTGTQTGFLSWLRGKGDGTFETAVSISQILNGCTDPRALSIVDLDLDGRPEISVLCMSTQLVWIGRRHSDAGGTWIFQTGPTINASGGSNGTVMKWGRLNTSTVSGVDLVVGGIDAINTLRIINGVSLTVTSTATGSFNLSSTAGSYMQLNGYLSDVDLADLNADGYGDILIGMYSQSTDRISQIYYTCATAVTAGTCSSLAWGMESYGVGPVLAGDVTGDDLPEVFIGYKTTTTRLINRTILRVTNLSQ
ncbi:MAG: putative Ig domain-containing protein [Proteobacteria bacterium]|nr:putative Ig domain-containing protein [Pseudomonadota bacterium]